MGVLGKVGFENLQLAGVEFFVKSGNVAIFGGKNAGSGVHANIFCTTIWTNENGVIMNSRIREG